MKTFVVIAIGVGLLVALSIWSEAQKKKKRRAALMLKYGDERIVDMIMSRTMWQGQTPEQLLDALGRPVDIDQRVMKTKTKEVWKYRQTGRGRFALRVTLENDRVIGWDQK